MHYRANKRVHKYANLLNCSLSAQYLWLPAFTCIFGILEVGDALSYKYWRWLDGVLLHLVWAYKIILVM